MPASPSALSQQQAIREQMAALTVGLPTLTSGPSASGWALFADAPVDYGGAVRHAAYATAVAARLLRSAGLPYLDLYGGAASYATHALPYITATVTTDGMTQVLQEARAAIAAQLQKARSFTPTAATTQAVGQVAAVVGRLQAQSDPTAIAKMQDEDTGPIAAFRKAMAQLTHAARIAMIAAAVLGGIAAAAAAYALWRGGRRRKAAA